MSKENFETNPKTKLKRVPKRAVIDKKEVSFRPHQFSLDRTKEHSQLLNIDFQKTVSKGWCEEFHFKVGQRIVIFYSQLNMSQVTKIWVKPILF